MSRKCELVTNLIKAERKLSGSHGTHQGREMHLRTISTVIHALGYVDVTAIKDITVKHIEAYITARLEEGISKRTLHNHMAALRSVLTEIGKANFAESELISNKTLGLGGASRAGTKEAIPEAMYSQVLSRLRDPGVRAGLALCLHLGLRCEEMIRSVESLVTWEKTLSQGIRTLTIIFGTKGGKKRDAVIVDVPAALIAVREAIKVVEHQGGKLINRPNLKKAADTVTSKTKTAGMGGLHTVHSLRYNYAQSLKKWFISQEYTEKEAKALVSLSLGHGDGRGVYVERTYAQKSTCTPSNVTSESDAKDAILKQKDDLIVNDSLKSAVIAPLTTRRWPVINFAPKRRTRKIQRTNGRWLSTGVTAPKLLSNKRAQRT